MSGNWYNPYVIGLEFADQKRFHPFLAIWNREEGTGKIIGRS